MTDEQKVWNEWLATRPPEIQAVAKTYPPGIYRLKNNEVPLDYLLVGYTEAEIPELPPTVILETEGLNGMFPRTVYGVSLDELIPVEVFNQENQ